MGNKRPVRWEIAHCSSCGNEFRYNPAWANIPASCNGCVVKERMYLLRDIDFVGTHNYLSRLIMSNPDEAELRALLGKPSRYILPAKLPEVFDALSLIRKQLHDFILKASTRDQLIEMVSENKKVAKLCLSIQTVFKAERKVSRTSEDPWNSINSTKPMPGGAPGSRR